jgi:hypothetical protein
MAKWTNLEKNVGALSANWPKSDSEVSHWTALHESVGALRGLMEVLDNAFESIDQNPDLSPSGRTRWRTEEAERTLKELQSYAPLTKASNAVARRIEKLKEKILPPVDAGASAADIALAAEVRAFIRSQPDPSKFVLEHRTDEKLVRSLQRPGVVKRSHR